MGNASLASVQSNLIALSNGDFTSFWEGTNVNNSSPTTVAATFPSVADYVPLTYTDAFGSLVYLTLIAPKSAIFLADKETVDPAAIAALNTAVIGTVLSGTGNPVTAYIGGVRRRILREYQ